MVKALKQIFERDRERESLSSYSYDGMCVNSWIRMYWFGKHPCLVSDWVSVIDTVALSWCVCGL